MKIILVLFLSFCLMVSCRHEEKYPKVVFNKCTGKYSIQTGMGYPSYGMYVFSSKPEMRYIGEVFIRGIFLTPGHTSPFAPSDYAMLGMEYQFTSQKEAAIFMNRWVDSVNAEQIQASRNVEVQDSLFKCQHTYE